MRPYVNNSRVIGADLRNEVKGYATSLVIRTHPGA
jgi:hypothetical protein